MCHIYVTLIENNPLGVLALKAKPFFATTNLSHLCHSDREQPRGCPGYEAKPKADSLPKLIYHIYVTLIENNPLGVLALKAEP